MTNLDPKHLDALVADFRNGRICAENGAKCCTMDEPSGCYCAMAADTITALRAQIDRERAATIEAAAKKVSDAEIGYYDGISGDWHPYRTSVVLSNVCASIRALHTDATRAAMDTVRREGYEAGVRDERAKSADLVKAVRIARKAMSTRVNGGWGWMAEFEALIAASIPPDPDTTPRK